MSVKIPIDMIDPNETHFTKYPMNLNFWYPKLFTIVMNVGISDIPEYGSKPIKGPIEKQHNN